MKPSSRSLTVQLTKNTPALTHKHTHSTTYSDTRGPCDVSKGDFPCHTRVSDRLYKCCVTVWLPLSFRFSLCFCVSGCLSLSVHVASIHRVFASPPEPSLTLSRLPAIPNSAVLFTLALLFFISEHLSLHYLCLLNFPFHKSRSEFFFFFLFFFLEGYVMKKNITDRQWYPDADLDISLWLLWFSSVLRQECALMSGVQPEMIFHTQNVNIMSTGFQNMLGMSSRTNCV